MAQYRFWSGLRKPNLDSLCCYWPMGRLTSFPRPVDVAESMYHHGMKFLRCYKSLCWICVRQDLNTCMRAFRTALGSNKCLGWLPSCQGWQTRMVDETQIPCSLVAIGRSWLHTVVIPWASFEVCESDDHMTINTTTRQCGRTPNFPKDMS